MSLFARLDLLWLRNNQEIGLPSLITKSADSRSRGALVEATIIPPPERYSNILAIAASVRLSSICEVGSSKSKSGFDSTNNLSSSM